jgi:hypothetical protein
VLLGGCYVVKSCSVSRKFVDEWKKALVIYYRIGSFISGGGGSTPVLLYIRVFRVGATYAIAYV